LVDDGADRYVMAVSKDNRALRRFLAWLSEDDVEVMVWQTTMFRSSSSWSTGAASRRTPSRCK